ncbi:unnamed protein product, partial [marine sediment metagenome]
TRAADLDADKPYKPDENAQQRDIGETQEVVSLSAARDAQLFAEDWPGQPGKAAKQ